MEVIVLFLLSRSMSKTLSGFVSINLMSFIFLPGIILHELAHLLMAVTLFVPVGNMEFAPRRNGNAVKLGSVEIGKTDPIRRSIIGFAPVLLGLVIVAGIVYLFTSNILFLQEKGAAVFAALVFAAGYLLFAISNTMFASSKDMEGTLEILIALLVVFAAVYILGFRPSLSLLDKVFTKEFIAVIQRSTLFLLAPILLDLFILGVIKLITRSRSRIE